MTGRAKIGCLLLVGLSATGLDARSEPQGPPPGSVESPQAAAAASALQLGDAAFAAGDYEEAVAAYSRISPLEIPVDAQNRLAMSYQMRQMAREAEAIYRVARARDSGYAPTYNNLGALYYARGDFKGAEDRFREALSYRPDSHVIQSNLHAAKYARENSRTALAQAERVRVESPVLVEGIGEEIFEVALLRDPEVDAELRNLEIRGDVFVARKLFEDAIIEYGRYIAIDEYDAMLWNKLGIAYQQIQRIDDAEDQYRRALRLNPYFVAALNNLGSVEQGRRDYPMALDYYRRALEINEESPTVLQNLGSCLFAMERYEEGLVAYIRAIQIDPSLFDRIGGGGGTLVQTSPGNESMTNFYLAKLFAGSGDLDRTMSFLYRAVEEGFDDAGMLDDPVFSELRSDDRFVRLVASLGETS